MERPTSTSRKSGSTSPRLKRTLKREVGYRPIEEEDLRWVYVAYKKGCLDSWMPEGLGPQEFNEAFLERMTLVHQVMVLFAPGHREGQFVGLVSLEMDFNENLETHALWMPWASKRNILEASLKFLVEMGKQFNMLIFCERKNRPFFEHLAKYGVLKRVGWIDRYFGSGDPKEKESALLFQSRVL